MRCSLILVFFSFTLLVMLNSHIVGNEDSASALMYDLDGSFVGEVYLVQTNAGVLLRGELEGISEGWHAFHVHSAGSCEINTQFKSAGSHFNPFNKKHGLLNREGPHAGDMPNVYADAEGIVRIEFLNPLVSLGDSVDSVLGKALMLHANPDDYLTDPTGDAGSRIACGVINKT